MWHTFSTETPFQEFHFEWKRCTYFAWMRQPAEWVSERERERVSERERERCTYSACMRQPAEWVREREREWERERERCTYSAWKRQPAECVREREWMSERERTESEWERENRERERERERERCTYFACMRQPAGLANSIVTQILQTFLIRPDQTIQSTIFLITRNIRHRTQCYQPWPRLPPSMQLLDRHQIPSHKYADNPIISAQSIHSPQINPKYSLTFVLIIH